MSENACFFSSNRGFIQTSEEFKFSSPGWPATFHPWQLYGHILCPSIVCLPDVGAYETITIMRPWISSASKNVVEKGNYGNCLRLSENCRWVEDRTQGPQFLVRCSRCKAAPPSHFNVLRHREKAFLRFPLLHPKAIMAIQWMNERFTFYGEIPDGIRVIYHQVSSPSQTSEQRSDPTLTSFSRFKLAVWIRNWVCLKGINLHTISWKASPVGQPFIRADPPILPSPGQKEQNRRRAWKVGTCETAKFDPRYCVERMDEVDDDDDNVRGGPTGYYTGNVRIQYDVWQISK